MIITAGGWIVREITLDCGEWCYFLNEKGIRYIVTNIDGNLIVTKTRSNRRLKPTKEMRAVLGSAITIA